jgi:hypothetical protein
MGEFLFFAVIIFFSIIESIARKRKAEKAGEDGAVPTELQDELERRFAWANQPAVESPGFDDEPSSPADASAEEVRERARRSFRGGTQQAYREAEEPERDTAAPPRMSPGDLLAELSGLVGTLESERQDARTLQIPAQSPSLDVRSAPGRAPARTASRVPARSAPQLPAASTSRVRPASGIHSTHEGYGTAPSGRAPSQQDGLDPLRRRLSGDARAVRDQLMSHSASSLRRALILREVLGPPVSLRDG